MDFDLIGDDEWITSSTHLLLLSGEPSAASLADQSTLLSEKVVKISLEMICSLELFPTSTEINLQRRSLPVASPAVR